MTEVPPPDWAALFQKHRGAMYGVAARTLRGAGRAVDPADVVMMAMESLMKKPPAGVKNWEALMVETTKRRALDVLKSAAVQRTSASELEDHDGASPATLEDDVLDAITLREKVALLDDRHRHVAWEYIAKGRPRDEVAAGLGVSPARISQMATKALKELKEALEKEGVKP